MCVYKYNFFKVLFYMIDNFVEMKIILKKIKKWKIEYVDNDVIRYDLVNVLVLDLYDFIYVWELNFYNIVGFGVGDCLGERDVIIV